MPATLATVTAITKEIYEGKLQNQLQNEAVGYKRIEQTSEGTSTEVGGRYVTFPLKVRRNAGIGYRNELEALQAAGQQGYASARVALAYGYGRVRLSGPTFDLVETNAQAFASAMQEEMDGLKDDVLKDTNRIFYGNGVGAMATVTADGANTVTVGNTQYLEVGQQIDIIDPTGVTVRASNRQITAINTATGVVTYDGADVTAVAGDFIVRTGNYGREAQGLTSIVSDTGTLFNIDPTVEPKWKSVNNNNGGTPRALSEALLINLTDAVRINGGKTSVLLASLGVRRAYFNLLTQQRRFVDTKEFSGGLTGLAFNNGREIPFVEDPDAPPSKVWGLDESTFKIYRTKPWYFDDKDGSVWKWVSGFDAYEAMLKQYWQLGCKRRNANAVLADISEA
jgi:hypothetical protein